MKLYSKTVCLLIMMLIITTILAPATSAEAPYEGYNYSYWKKAAPSAIPYIPNLVLDGRDAEYGSLSEPDDLYVQNDKIYILDTGNDRIVILNKDYQFITEIKDFQNSAGKDQFNKPQGIFVTEQEDIYVADTGNRRVVQLTGEGKFIREIGRPESDVIRPGFEYHPIKIAVDKAQRIYVIGRGIYDGIIEFDPDGVFTGFTGANKVKFKPIDYFWRMLATKAQRAKMALFIPIEFNNLDLDEEGFIYTTNSEKNTITPLQRLNPTGTDVIRKEGYHPIVGDIQFPFKGNLAGGSTFIDVNINEYGMYSGLDLKRGRIFTYDEDGNLLYIFGKLGDQVGTFKTPSAIERLGEDILVLDKGYQNLVVFKPTEFGRNVNEAVKQYHLGNDQGSAAYWKKVLRLDANNEVAYVGIGKALLMEGKNKEAMAYFKNGNSKKYYSKAFKRYRQELLRGNFGFIMSVIVLIPLLLFAVKLYRSFRRRRANAVVE
ncbi:NHL repeat-containing protein [Lederbergia citrea]|uniref:NHL repeat-containing protein n=1 Tax=Lederbergia citrea TaxID=2833581 RepID=UPI001BC95DC2|nr:NHL repeat-containing protein [Lederbergia citrea]MBS4178995.1 NHL repeat-containing protein [Lederbergia citrea]